jgi:hypothetical protein
VSQFASGEKLRAGLRQRLDDPLHILDLNFWVVLQKLSVQLLFQKLELCKETVFILLKSFHTVGKKKIEVRY